MRLTAHTFDNQDGADTLCELLKQWKHVAHIAYTAVDGMRLAKLLIPDIILLDIGMPGLSGYEAARELRKDPNLKKTLLVAVTGYPDDEHRHRAHAAGFNLHCRKPIEEKDLKTILKQPASKPASRHSPTSLSVKYL